MFVPHRRYTYVSPWSVTDIASLSGNLHRDEADTKMYCRYSPLTETFQSAAIFNDDEASGVFYTNNVRMLDSIDFTDGNYVRENCITLRFKVARFASGN
jgi:hypothetical protein